MAGKPNTIDHQLRTAADSRGSQQFLTFEDDTLSYAQLEEATARVANGLQDLGIEQGEHIALLMRNRTEFPLAWLGANRAGNPIVPVNAGLKSDGLAHIINHSDSVAVIVEDEQVPALLGVLDRIPKVRRIVVVGDAEVPQAQPWDVLATAKPGAPDVDTEPTDVMMLMYTSGTTGLPKGVVLHQGRIMGGRFVLELAGVTTDDVAYTPLPLFHSNAAIISFWGAFNMGIPLTLGRKFSASRHWDEIRRSGATFFNALGAMMPILYKQPERPDDAENPCRLVLSAACPKEIWEPFEQRFGVDIVEFYGTVEGGLTMAGPGAPIGSIGKEVAGNEIKILKEDGAEAAPNEVGELVCRPAGGAKAQVSYYKNEEASQKKTEGGWLHTGDRAYRDENGYLWYVDRGDHFMRRRGENISSTEVEAAVGEHPAVLECAAYGVPSELAEDEVVIAVVAKEGATIDPPELIAFCEEHLASFQVPRYVRVMEALPKTETHRAQKVALSKEGVTADMWDREAAKAR